MVQTKKQQTIEATLGRPTVKIPKVRAPKKATHRRRDNSAISLSDRPKSRFDSEKAGADNLSGEPQPPSSNFMPNSGGRRTLLADSSSSAAETSTLGESEGDAIPKAKAAHPKLATPGKATHKKQTRLAIGMGNLGLGSSPGSAVVLDDESSDDLPKATSRASKRAATKKHAQPTSTSDDTDDVPLIAPKASNRRSHRQHHKRATAVDDSGSDDDLPVIMPKASNSQRPPNRGKRALPGGHGDDDSDDDDVVVSSAKRRRLTRRDGTVPSSSVEPSASDAVSPTPDEPISSPIKRKARGPRSEKRKQLELLRRRRAGEAVELPSSSSSSDEERRGLYDTDSDHPALEEFEDDEEGVPEPQPRTKEKKGSRKKNRKKDEDTKVDPGDDEEAKDEMSDFIDNDDEEVLGVPGELLGIPIEFSSHSHKPLGEYFCHVVEWLVRFKFEPNFDEKHDELYLIAWRKLDDEVQGLANSKFASSAWKLEFHRALHARPKFVSIEIPRGDVTEFSTCEACGRSGHPATWVVQFAGPPYYRKSTRHPHFLEDVESDDDSDDASDDESAKRDRDEDNRTIEPEHKEWSVGAVCKSNAETAHMLTHWKHNLLEWVSDRLDNDGFMEPEQIAARMRMKRKKRNKIVDGIIEKWERQRVIEGLYRDFKTVLEDARNKSTTGRGGRRWGH